MRTRSRTFRALLLITMCGVACADAGTPTGPEGPASQDEPPTGGPPPPPGDPGPQPPTEPAPTYAWGAPFEPPEGRVLHGMGQWHEYNAKLLAALPLALHPAAELLFVSLGDTPRGWNPEQIAATLRDYEQQGRIPQMDIALRGLQPPHAVLDTMADPLYGIDDEIATGTQYDARILDLARVVKEFGRPVLIRIGGEFSGPWNGYHPWHYPKAFRKIVHMFREAGAANAAFVWCYEPASPADFAERNAQGEYKWYPGADVVDWFAIDWFAKEDFSGPLTGGGRRPGADGEELAPHGRSRLFLDMAVSESRPVMVAESSPVQFDLSDPAQAEAAWQEWFLPYFAIIAERPEIEWFHLISYDWTRASYYAQIGWKNNDFTANATLMERIAAELAKPEYLHASEKALLRGFGAPD